MSQIENQDQEYRANKRASRGIVLLRWLVPVLILVGVLGFVLIWVWRALPQIAIAEISALTNSRVETKSIDFKSDGSVLIEELVIRPKQEQKYTDALLKAKTVYARFSICSLLLLGPRLKEIRINDFVFNAQYDLDTGRWNLAALKFKTYKDGAGKMPLIVLDGGTLQYSKVSKGQAKVLAAVPIDMRFRPAEEILGGYSFDITTAERADSGRSRLVGSWRPGRITIAGGISSIGISALENAWVIDVLDAELNYDRSKKFSLKLKIKDLLYTKESAGDALAFDRPAFLTKFGLFTALQRFFSRYNPAGKVDMDLEVSGKFNQLSESTVAGRVYCKDVAICDRKFPYAIKQVTGPVDFTENSVVLNNLSGKHGEVKVTFTGWVKDVGPNQRYQIQIESDNMTLDDDLYNALSTKQKEFWKAFSPSGLAAIDYRFSRQSQAVKDKTLAVELRGAEATYRGFPYPLKNLTGKLFFDRHNIIVSDVVSQANGGKITFNGIVTERNTDRPIYNLLIKANDIPFDSMFARTLLAKQSDLYNQFDITGWADAEVKIFTPAEDVGSTSFLADLTLKKTSLKANKTGLTISDVSAKVNLTPASTSIKDFTGRYGQSQVSLVGGIWSTDKTQLSHYYFTLDAQQAQLSDELIGMLPEPVEKVASQLQPAGKVNISANLRKASSEDRPNYSISVECLGDSIIFKRFAYPLKDVTGTLKITNNKVTLDDITAAPADGTRETTDSSTIKLNGQIALADNAISSGIFQLSARNISFGEHLACALPAGAGAFYQALTPTGRFDLDLENVEIFEADKGEKHIAFTVTTGLKSCNFNISGTQAELGAVLKTRGLYKIGMGLSDGQVSILADNLKIKGKSITNLKAELNYDPGRQSWSAENLVADCYSGKLAGKLEVKPAAAHLEYILQTGFGNIDLKQFLLGEDFGELSRAETAKNGYTSGTMSGSLTIGAQIGDNSSRLGRCRLAIKDMQVGKLSPLAKLLYVLRLTKPKNFAFERMVVDSYIRSDKLLFDEFDLAGETVAFHGSGWMDLKSQNVNLSLTARGKRLVGAEPSFLESLTEGLGQAVVRMEVTGNVYDPKVETKLAPVVEDSLKILGTPR